MEAQFCRGPKRRERIKSVFKLMEYDILTDKQLDLVVKYEDTFGRFGHLTDRQCEVLESIFKEAAEKA